MEYSLDDPARINSIRATILRKGFLKRFYAEVYNKYRSILTRIPETGLLVEIGSGAGFAKSLVPELITSDVLPYQGVDQVVDATKMPFENASVRAFFLMNAFHHIPDVAAFLKEVERCLVPGGRVFIFDQHVSRLSRILLGKLHHEPFLPDAIDWKFPSHGPLTSANGALAWIVFQRDLKKLESLFPTLALEYYRPHSPLRYWLAGGLKSWTLLPGWSFSFVTKIEKFFLKIFPGTACFVDIEVVKTSATTFPFFVRRD